MIFGLIYRDDDRYHLGTYNEDGIITAFRDFKSLDTSMCAQYTTLQEKQILLVECGFLPEAQIHIRTLAILTLTDPILVLLSAPEIAADFFLQTYEKQVLPLIRDMFDTHDKKRIAKAPLKIPPRKKKPEEGS